MIYFFIFSVVLSLYLYNSWRNSPRLKLPPGPWNFPIVGNLQWLAKFPWEHFSKFGKIYGPLVYLKLGKTRVFLLNDIVTWKDAYSRPELSRHPGRVFESILENKSIIFGDGNPEIKHYMRKSLIDFGRNSLENLTLEEISFLMQKFVESNGKPVPVQSLFSIPTVNMLWTLLFGKRISDQDTNLHRIAKEITAGSTNSSFLGRQSVLMLIPYMSKIFPSLSRQDYVRSVLVELVRIFQNQIMEHSRTRRNSEIRDITDAYFDKVEQTDPNSNSFFATGDSLHLVYMGLFLAGVDSTSTSLEWLLLFLATNPTVQTRFQTEIDDILGNRQPSLIDRERMPYALAAIQEMFRLSAIDITQFHQAKEHTKLLGFDIPKGSILVPNLYGINRDTEVWGDADVFRPERFIDADGKFQKSEKFITFGYGKRSCLGESIAKNQIFLFATSIFQSFNVKIHGEVPPLNGTFGFLHHPYNFDVVFEKRNNNVF